MSKLHVLFLLTYVFGMSLGQYLFKHAAATISESRDLTQIIHSLMHSGHFWAAIILYGLLTIFWVWLLSFIPLSRAYPFVALSIALTILVGWVLFREAFHVTEAAGCLFIIFGVCLIAWRY